ncbi:endoribonuclease Dicer-like isoform X3 [Porites lutea]|uniref:endoribonuclease Dicer-like isoform X3 n=1 Tax=Porites lutea TaxID=51062 RepID=UPI003CC59B64
MESEDSAEDSSASETETETQQEDRNVEVGFTARPYQVELLERSLERNTIVCLGTGTGKTFISVMLIKELSHQIRDTYKNVPLASQQAKVIDKNTDLNVRHYVGEMGVDFWDKKIWEKEFNDNNILVMTAEIFLNLLLHSYIKLSQVNLLIFDECHHATKNHAYKQIMECFVDCKKTDHPKIMGLTASVVNKKVKPWNIESEMRELECTLRSTCETSQDEEVEKFAAKPNELVLKFSNADIDDNTKMLIQILQDVLSPGMGFLLDCKVRREGPSGNAHWYAKYTFRECQETLSELGPWAANKVAGHLIKDLERACIFQDSKEGRMLCEFSATQLRLLQSVYHNYTSAGSEDTGSTEEFYIMPKLQLLLSVLREFGNSQNSENKLCGIVFVERRYTALVLSKQINIAANLYPELSFIKSNFVIGHGTGGKVNYSNETEMNFKKQEEVLRQFRLHKFNLLIATCVVEEGLDIPRCNLVCRFDFPMTFRSYVQSKGRARAKDSNYIILVDEEEYEEKQGELERMRDIEDILSEKCHGREEPTNEECDEVADADTFLPPYKPENGQGARVTMSSSVSLLTRYCSKLPGDRFTHLSPIYKFEEVGRNVYLCKLQLPNNCQLRRTIYGIPMPRRNLAKMAAAFYACVELHKIGELDDNLLPVRSLSDCESESEEEEEGFAGKKREKAGTKKRKRVYQRKVPQVFRGSLPQESQPQYLTAITITITKLTSRQGLDVSQRYFTDGVCRLFGLLTNVPIPAVRSFKLYPDYGEVTVTIKCHKAPLRARMTQQDLEIAQKFHCFLFSQALRESVRFKPKGSDGSTDGYFVVLLKPNGYDVDYDSMRHALTRQTSLKLLTGETCKIDVDMVVSKNYTESRQKFAVLNVRHDRSPMSPFPDKSKAKTFEGYFREYYGKSFTTMKQPLIEVKDISGRVNFLVDRKVAAKTKRDVIELFPELCNVFPISASLLSVSLMLPSILHRVNALLLVGDVKTMVDGERDNTDESSLPSIGAGYANDGKSLLRTDKDSFSSKKNVGRKDYNELFSDLKSLFNGKRTATVHPDSAFVLQALTTTHSGDAFNLERLEMLGDAFLKLAVSLHLYCTYHDKDEGKLTLRKVRQISNLALFRGAERTSLAGFQQSTQLARDVWCPTGCQQSTAESGVTAMEVDDADSAEHQGLGSRRDKCNTQVIADKSVADSMEALIGAYLICCGYTGALRFMKFLGLKVLPEDDDIDTDIGELAEKSRKGCYARFWPEQPNTSAAYQSHDMLSQMVSGLENFEKNSIKYTFNSKLYLVEALTHASYQANRVTPCYQRLEFLGDALLDFLVTQHLYFRHEKLSPGELTDIRQALVNNNIFAAIAVKYEYNKYLRQMSPKWFKSIETFITRLDDEKEENLGIADPFIIISTKDEEGIEAPKVLGDIYESVAGAVFLDSGMDLTKVWEVYYRMMQPYIDHYSVNIPINPIRRVYEEDNEREFSKAEVLADGRVKCTLRVSWGKFDGYGKNSKIAKATAAKLAVQALDRRDSPGTSQGSG